MSKSVILVAGVRGAWSSESLAAALRQEGASSFVLPIEECVHDLDQGTVSWDHRVLNGIDGIVVKKLGDATAGQAEERLQILEALQSTGVTVMSRPHAIWSAVNRYRMSYLLRSANIPMPRTVVTESLDEAEETVQAWGRVVLKPLFTSKGRGMILLGSNMATRLALRKRQQEGLVPYYLQDFVHSPGRDLAVAMLGGEVLGAYYRVASSDQWMTTTSQGGHYEPAVLVDSARELSTAACQAFGLDFTVVDLVETENGWLVYEVSAFGGFSGLKQSLGVDAAEAYARYAISKVGS